jgi:hypothetical protein
MRPRYRRAALAAQAVRQPQKRFSRQRLQREVGGAHVCELVVLRRDER